MSAAFLLAALTLIPTLMPGARRRLAALLAILMLSTMSMLTSELETPSAWAKASLKLARLASLNSDSTNGIDTAIVTLKGLVVSEEELLRTDVHEAAAGDDEIFPATHVVHVEAPAVSE